MGWICDSSPVQDTRVSVNRKRFVIMWKISVFLFACRYFSVSTYENNETQLLREG